MSASISPVVNIHSPLTEVLDVLNQTGYRAVVVVDTDLLVVGLIADYDVRRALLAGASLDTPAAMFMNNSFTFGNAYETLKQHIEVMKSKKVDIMPLLDEQGRFVEFLRLKDYDKTAELKSPIVIMAGGYGKRLMPLTANTPKPLLPIGEKPLLAHTLEHLAENGFSQTYLTTHYLPEKFEEFVAENDTGLNVQMIHESEPTGTAGSLRHLNMAESTEPVFVMNGDILTKLDFAAMYRWHQKHGNHLTIASCYYQHTIPYGVLSLTDDQSVTHIDEKPTKLYPVNAGMYLISPESLKLIPSDKPTVDMPELINTTLSSGLKVGNFPISEYWSDIGHIHEYEKANREYKSISATVGKA